jgi:hypothetical protein
MRSILGTVALAALLLTGGCSQAQMEQRVQGARQELGQAAANAQQAAANQALEAKVKSALATRKGMDAKGINVEARNGHVVLKGDVAGREQADLAIRVTQETEGVTSVENQLTMRVPVNQMPPTTTQPAVPGTTPGATTTPGANQPSY